MSEVRDSQRAKLYKAETFLMVFGKGQERLSTVQSIEEYVAHVLSSVWLIKRYPCLANAKIEVRDGRGRIRACGAYSYIKMPKWSRCKAVVLHELAHSFIKRIYHHEVAAHGWEFCDLLLEMVQHFLGSDAGSELKASYKKHRVRWHSKKTRSADKPKRQMPPQALEALRKWREQRKAAKEITSS